MASNVRHEAAAEILREAVAPSELQVELFGRDGFVRIDGTWYPSSSPSRMKAHATW
jgi:hypothetical protein